MKLNETGEAWNSAKRRFNDLIGLLSSKNRNVTQRLLPSIERNAEKVYLA